MNVPDWVKDAVFYQIFPDRFFNGDHSNDPENVKSWGSKPTLWGFQGGDLEGIIQKLDYLLDLGINAIYLNPIFHASSNHRYNTTDYYKIDPKLGSFSTFQKLLEQAHGCGIKIMLDGVFNHTGRGFFAFNDILENGEHSPYKNWYHIHHFPVNAYGDGEAADYHAWWNYKSLPKLNTSHPAVRKYLFHIAEYWIGLGVDGWRLDVPNEIDDDSFWEEFRHRVRNVNPQAYLLGEIWELDSRWVNETHFDGIINYPLKNALVDFLMQQSAAEQFQVKIKEITTAYPKENLFSMFNVLGSHDTQRIFTVLQEEEALVRLAYLFLLTFPGAPSIYYGDEVGLTGGKDPLNRKAFPWNRNQWRSGLRDWIQKLIQIRKDQPVLREGELILIDSGEHQRVFCFARQLKQEVCLIVINASEAEIEAEVQIGELGLNDGMVFNALLGSERFLVKGEGDMLPVKISAKAGLVLKAD